jgi:hypothetical protein
MSDKRSPMTIMVKPSIKKRLILWATERGCKPCDVLEELVLDGLADVAIAEVKAKSATSQTDIFADRGDVTKKIIEKHYPNKIAKSGVIA